MNQDTTNESWIMPLMIMNQDATNESWIIQLMILNQDATNVHDASTVIILISMITMYAEIII